MSKPDYDLKSIETEEDDIDVDDWLLQSAINPEKMYRIIDKEPVEYFDYRLRYKVSVHRDKGEPKYAFCVQFNTLSGTFQ